MRSREMVIAFKENDKNRPLVPLPKVLPLPAKHAYIRTATYAKPPTQYEELRTKAAISKRGIEASLSKYLAKTCKSTCNLFDDDDDDSNFLLISSTETNSKPSYLFALNPSDQVFDCDELEYYYELRNAKVEKEESDESNSPRQEFIEFDVSPQREENSEEMMELSQPKSEEKPAYENPYQRLISQ